MCFVVNDVKFLVGTICLKISHQSPLQGPHKPLLLISRIFSLTRTSFKLLALRNPIIGTCLRTLLCSLSGAKRSYILLIISFNWAKESWYAIFRTNLSSFSFLLWQLNNSALENLLAFKICFRTILSLYSLSLSYIPQIVISFIQK